MRFLLRLGNHEVQLTPGRWRIGRDPSCEIRIDDDLVSRTHAVLEVTRDRVSVRDEGSSNGVKVDGRLIDGETGLMPGCMITLGSIEMVLVVNPSDAVPGISPPTRPMPAVSDDAKAGLEKLSPRERQVLDLLAKGYAQREVSERLGLSIKTVETYRARLGDKLGIRTRSDLVRYALNAGILRPE